jgi:hypothetical protein
VALSASSSGSPVLRAKLGPLTDFNLITTCTAADTLKTDANLDPHRPRRAVPRRGRLPSHPGVAVAEDHDTGTAERGGGSVKLLKSMMRQPVGADRVGMRQAMFTRGGRNQDHPVPSAAARARVPPVKSASSSGCAWNETIVHGLIESISGSAISGLVAAAARRPPSTEFGQASARTSSSRWGPSLMIVTRRSVRAGNAQRTSSNIRTRGSGRLRRASGITLSAGRDRGPQHREILEVQPVTQHTG